VGRQQQERQQKNVLNYVYGTHRTFYLQTQGKKATSRSRYDWRLFHLCTISTKRGPGDGGNRKKGGGKLRTQKTTGRVFCKGQNCRKDLPSGTFRRNRFKKLLKEGREEQECVGKTLHIEKVGRENSKGPRSSGKVPKICQWSSGKSLSHKTTPFVSERRREKKI